MLAQMSVPCKPVVPVPTEQWGILQVPVRVQPERAAAHRCLLGHSVSLPHPARMALMSSK